ncbi:hypothetical protein AVEN_185737-1 [Araneus ventricosus]|uniref:Uncharacterized protein n=1 Tax=Araneus ventricosus TaxID=182803 RepID=A0A4Y2I1C8_ARAVE|nr:hypothetical protein AVEN_185737-1 [Araneus ventricosus]
MDLAILNYSQILGTTPELVPASPNFCTTSVGGFLATMYDVMCNRPHTWWIFSGIGFRTWNPLDPKPGLYHWDTAARVIVIEVKLNHA